MPKPHKQSQSKFPAPDPRADTANQVRFLRMDLQILALELEKIEDSAEASARGYAAIPHDIYIKFLNASREVQAVRQQFFRKTASSPFPLSMVASPCCSQTESAMKGGGSVVYPEGEIRES